MSAVRRLTALFLLAAVVSAGVVLGLASPAAAEDDRSSSRPAYGETVALDREGSLAVAASALAGVIGAGLIGYALWPAPRREKVRVRSDD